jgi:glycosyltransferase involved in cell wall biosynthesis
VYDVPGLRDSVRNGDTGILVEPSPAALADGMNRLWGDKNEYVRMATRARAWSSTLTYDATTDAVEQALVGRANFDSHAVSTWSL